jgi:hypothetical protein
MKWNDHSRLEGSHAFLSASGYHWINYDNQKLISTYKNKLATMRGTELHEFASHCIKLRQKLPRSEKALNTFVNDAIGFGMQSEQILYYSDNCFGTADAIFFGRQRGTDRLILRIHDLKTGENKGHIEQLMVYAALFCLEYKIKPIEIDIELRIYQYDDIFFCNPKPEEIVPIMDKIVTFDKLINKTREEEGY